MRLTLTPDAEQRVSGGSYSLPEHAFWKELRPDSGDLGLFRPVGAKLLCVLGVLACKGCSEPHAEIGAVPKSEFLKELRKFSSSQLPLQGVKRRRRLF